MEHAILDFEDVMNRIQDDMELLVELLEIYEEDFQVKMPQLETAISGQAVERVRDLAHSLKGASGNISAIRLREIFSVMEKEAAEGNITQAQALLDQARIQFKELQGVMSKVRNGEISA